MADNLLVQFLAFMAFFYGLPALLICGLTRRVGFSQWVFCAIVMLFSTLFIGTLLIAVLNAIAPQPWTPEFSMIPLRAVLALLVGGTVGGLVAAAILRKSQPDGTLGRQAAHLGPRRTSDITIPQASLEALRRAAERAPDSAAAWLKLGRCLAWEGQAEEAVQAYRRAVALDPGHPVAWYGLGTLLKEHGDMAGALDAFSRASQAEPAAEAPWITQGAVYHTQGRFEDAEAAFRRALELAGPAAAKPHHRPILRRRLLVMDHPRFYAWSKLGSLFHAWLKLDEAEAAFREAAGLAESGSEPVPAEERATMLAALAAVLREKEDAAECARVARAAVEAGPNQAHAWLCLGWALHRQGRREEGAAAWRRALAEGAPPLWIWHEAAEVLEAVERPEDALIAWRQATTTDPTHGASWFGLALALSRAGDTGGPRLQPGATWRGLARSPRHASV